MIRNYNPLYVSYEELYEAYLDCRKRKRTTANSIEFEKDDNYKLYQLYDELNTMTYEIGVQLLFVLTSQLNVRYLLLILETVLCIILL